jgi:hypothetical protein
VVQFSFENVTARSKELFLGYRIEVKAQRRELLKRAILINYIDHSLVLGSFLVIISF